jgi:hypothetical protein
MINQECDGDMILAFKTNDIVRTDMLNAFGANIDTVNLANFGPIYCTPSPGLEGERIQF